MLVIAAAALILAVALALLRNMRRKHSLTPSVRSSDPDIDVSLVRGRANSPDDEEMDEQGMHDVQEVPQEDDVECGSRCDSDADFDWDDNESLVSDVNSHASETPSATSLHSGTSNNSAASNARLLGAGSRRGAHMMPIKFAWDDRRIEGHLSLKRPLSECTVTELVRLLAKAGTGLLGQDITPSMMRIDAKQRKKNGSTMRVPVTPRTKLRELKRTEALLITQWKDVAKAPEPAATVQEPSKTSSLESGNVEADFD